MAFVRPTRKLRFQIPRLLVAFVFGSSAIMRPSAGIVLHSARHWTLTRFGAKIARNSKFHIRIVLRQFRDSVMPALIFLDI